MNNHYQKNSGIFLLTGSFLMIVTMVLHPVGGGGFEQLLEKSTMAIISHSIAILSVPFSGLGFLGLTYYLNKDLFFSRLAFVVILVGLLAAMMAATLNGLAQPMFAAYYQEATPEVLAAIRPIFRYNMALNHSFDYILMASMFLSVLSWSLAILLTDAMPRWIGYFGILLVAALLISIIAGFYFLDLHGFRLFVFGWTLWIISVALRMIRSGKVVSVPK